jgi:hypothetical protein
LPPDWRLNFEFQNHILRREDKSTKRIDIATLDPIESRYRELHAIGGAFIVQEIGDGLAGIYSMRHQEPVTALDIEMLIALPATTVQATLGWKLNHKSKFKALRWNRIM